MNDFWLYALLFGLFIVLGLAVWAGHLLKKVSNQTKQQAELKKSQQVALNSHDEKVLDSVLLITRAMMQEQCEYDEGCWRLSVLLSSLKTLSGMSTKFSAVFGLYGEIKKLSILGARKTLSKKERMREDYQHMTALNKYQDDIVNDLEKLHQFTTEQLTLLAPEKE